MNSIGIVSDSDFLNLHNQIMHESDSQGRKLEVLYSSIGKFQPAQVAGLLMIFKNPPDRIRAMQIMERRLVTMSCCDAKPILDAFTIHNDKLVALDLLKRTLVDSQDRTGQAHILSSFIYEEDKRRALNVLKTIRRDVFDKVPAGGHQLYGAIGYTLGQAPPLLPHLYGSVEEQQRNYPGHGDVAIAPQAQSGKVASLYTSHPSYGYKPGGNYAADRGLPGNEATAYAEHATATQMANGPMSYPEGAPPTCYHGGMPVATGFQKYEQRHKSPEDIVA